MITSCFTYFNEDQVLDLHLKTCYHTVDKFLIIEGDRTFRGSPKPQNFNIDLYKDFAAKIIYKYVSLPQDSNPWNIEKAQREYFRTYLPKETDIILLLDVDEIPDPAVIKNFAASNIPIAHIKMGLYNYYYNFKIGNWVLPKIMRRDFWNKCDIDSVRRNNHSFPVLEGGWHFSNVMSPEKFILKHKSFSHSERDNEFLSIENVTQAIEKKISAFPDIKFKTEVVNLNTLPLPIQENPKHYEMELVR